MDAWLQELKQFKADHTIGVLAAEFYQFHRDAQATSKINILKTVTEMPNVPINPITDCHYQASQFLSSTATKTWQRMQHLLEEQSETYQTPRALGTCDTLFFMA